MKYTISLRRFLKALHMATIGKKFVQAQIHDLVHIFLCHYIATVNSIQNIFLIVLLQKILNQLSRKKFER